ncbi:MAG: sulfite exporter TauE/SafE family protein [bacterium]|nr:sulfite exporter TauE/SafE family protein [bacterium]
MLEVPFLASMVSLTARNKKTAFIKSSTFVLGLITSYILIGLFFGKVAAVFSKYGRLSYYLFIVMGALSVYWGIKILFFSGSCNDANQCGCGHKHSSNSIFSRFKNVNHLSQIYLIGNAFAWLETPVCPCCGPVIYILSALTILKGKILFGIITFAVYSFGQGIPVIIFCVFLTHIVNHPVLLKSKEYFVLLESNILIFLGFLLLWIA